jgi:hypothetical protein
MLINFLILPCICVVSFFRCYRGVCVDSVCECEHGWTGDDCTIGDFFDGIDNSDGFLFLEDSSVTHGSSESVGWVSVAAGACLLVAAFGMFAGWMMKHRIKKAQSRADVDRPMIP